MTFTNWKSNLINLTVVNAIITIAGFFTSTCIGRPLGLAISNVMALFFYKRTV
jgi:hypothetical protein